ncbi:MAG: hypothetical protein K2H52_17285 [Lachnospiraceae bacterium]|nr:hypothetical protein [Lachnospiraceae bacterium]
MNAMPKRRPIFKAVQGFFTTWALMKASRMEPGNILTLLFFALSFIFYLYADERFSKSACENKRQLIRVSIITAVLFTLLYMAVDYPHYIETLTNPLFRLGILCSVFIGFTIIFYYLLRFLFSMTMDIVSLRSLLFTDCYDNTDCQTSAACRCRFLSSCTNRLLTFYRKHTVLCAFLLCMLCWLPYFLYQYPGIMTPDSLNQFEQVLGVIPYSNHHPFIHTLLIKLFYTIGLKITGSMLVALSFYTFFQMCMLSLSISYFIGTLRQYRVRPVICFVITLFYALVPYHAVYSVTIWKDILFAAAVLGFGCALLRLLKKTDVFDLCIFGICGLALCLFRSNGWYAFLLCLPFLFFYFRKRKKSMFPVLCGILLTAAIIKYPVMNRLHVIQPDLVESLSIPVQQVTAVICNDRELTAAQRTLIEQVVDLTYIKELYDPYFADNIKELVRAGNQDYLAAHKGEFLKLWASLLLRYPGDYLTAYIHQTYGYWYPDSFYLVAEAEGVSATTLGVSHTPLIGGPLVVKAKEIAIKLGGMLPLYGTLWSMGVACWVLIFCIGSAFIRSEKKKLILYLPSVALLLTVLIATPVATEFRYVYFMVLSLPFYLMSSVLILPGESKK